MHHNSGNTSLRLAASHGYLKATLILLGHNAALDTLDNDGYIPLLRASTSGILDVLNCCWATMLMHTCVAKGEILYYLLAAVQLAVGPGLVGWLGGKDPRRLCGFW